MKKTLALLALLALSACAATSSSPGNRVDWVCQGGKAFSARINAAGAAEVFAGGQTYTLPGIAAGSGTRYTNNSVEYWEHGREAMLNGAFAGPYENCRRG